MAPTDISKPAGYALDPNWQIKIFDGEPDYEAEHVTVIGKSGGRKTWRVNLRTLEVMNATPPVRLLPQELLDHIRANRRRIREAWNRMYPDRRIPLDDDNKLKGK